MIKNDDGRITITSDEANQIHEFIRSTLDRQWDRYTDHYICSDEWEDGMRRMDPDMYDFATKLNSLCNDKIW